MTRLTDGSGTIQTTSEPNPSTPAWFGDVVGIRSAVRKHGVRSTITAQVRVARKRFGRCDVRDVLAVLLGDAISGERSQEACDERLHPFAIPFLARFARDPWPSRSARSRF